MRMIEGMGNEQLEIVMEEGLGNWKGSKYNGAVAHHGLHQANKANVKRRYKDEFHTRLRFCRRDLITMANVGKDDNGSQFFFTLNCTPELQNKHTIFGEVTGESIYSMLKLEEALADENDRPLCPPILIKTIILNNPFSDTILRIIVQESEEEKDNSKTKTAAVKDFNLLSFGEEAEEDEEESVILNKKFSGKGESPHDHLTDPKLSLQPAVEPSGLASKKRKEVRISDWENDDELKTEEELAVVKKEKELVYYLHYNYVIESRNFY
ncbi:Peptidyl-prolyl cis-trans isomerase CWC27 like protein [Eufriesea mexicana]|uniref:Peptidyl-prolyl cis-trans isomerase n=1 Tax=Eufriesea mexicana TaxID=516756 RepID=A0A310SKK3_9HYME|nr:Peptidyl-prolyl cis-trans isomerase CWC27 like protein [Eufriesea mexicana]